MILQTNVYKNSNDNIFIVKIILYMIFYGF